MESVAIINKTKKRIYNPCITCKLVRASFGEPGKKIQCCKTCKTPEMIDLHNQSKLCITCLKTLASFDYPDQKKPKYCSKCQLPNMTNIIMKKCFKCLKTQATFGFNGKKQCCFKCKDEGMVCVDVSSFCKKCKIKKACFGLSGKKPQFCSNCKEDSMINLKPKKKCIACKTVIACFGYEHDKKATYCTKCKLDQMICITSKKCVVCKIKSCIFGLKSNNIADHCGDCRSDQMVSLKGRRCIICQETRPCFGYKTDKRPTYCNGCKLPQMINIIGKLCVVCKQTQPCFAYETDTIRTHCFSCREDNMIDIQNKSKMCTSCNSTRGNPKYKSLCLRCYIYTHPDEQNTRNYKIKEKHVTDYIFNQFPNTLMTFDRRIVDGCSKRRPDVLIQLSTHNCIVEIDESAHGKYDTTCEQSRINNLFEDLEHMPLIIIRFNPDKYVKAGIKIPSCFKLEQNSNCLIVGDKKQWNYRLEALKETIEWALNVIPDEPIQFKYLFFND